MLMKIAIRQVACDKIFWIIIPKKCKKSKIYDKSMFILIPKIITEHI